MKKSLVLIFVALALVSAFSLVANAQDGRFRPPVNGGSIYTPCKFDKTTCATSSYHTGIDIHSTGDDSILASNAGVIATIQVDGQSDHGMGNAIILKHTILNANGGVETIYSTYNHLNSFEPGLYVGEAVVKGQKIGTMGGTGHSSGCNNLPVSCWKKHLHFEIKRSNVLGSDPSGYWGYTPKSALNYKYIDPEFILNSNTTAIGNDYAYWDFKGFANLEGWNLFNFSSWSVNWNGNGNLSILPSGNDPHIDSPNLYVDASILKFVKFNMASNASDNAGCVYFRTDWSNSYSEDKKKCFTTKNDGTFNNYAIDMSSGTVCSNCWRGKITGIRIDPANYGTKTIAWNWIWLSSNSNPF
jgi:murein DD-endopeptidase MepM/ murein hydrolase activator NlpD